MSLIAFFLILASIVMHASWHFINKTGRATFPYYCVFSFALCLSMSPFLLASGISFAQIPGKVYLCLLTGGLCGMLSNVGLSWTYRTTDMSVAYPLTRAIPVVMTMAITGAFGLGKPLNYAVCAGMFVIFAGCLLTGITVFNSKTVKAVANRGILGILVAAGAVTGYTIADSYGVKGIMMIAPDVPSILKAGTYSCLREVVALTSLLIVTFPQKNLRKGFDRNLLCPWHPYAAGLIAAFAYLMVLLAMQHVTNVTYVQAFRQMSLPVGALMGVVILKEKLSLTRIIGILLILAGLVVTAVF